MTFSSSRQNAFPDAKYGAHFKSYSFFSGSFGYLDIYEHTSKNNFLIQAQCDR
jgi:hypothetical protein